MAHPVHLSTRTRRPCSQASRRADYGRQSRAPAAPPLSHSSRLTICATAVSRSCISAGSRGRASARRWAKVESPSQRERLGALGAKDGYGKVKGAFQAKDEGSQVVLPPGTHTDEMMRTGPSWGDY